MSSVRIGIDRGGTLTDCVAHYKKADGSEHIEVLKLLSQNPNNYQDAPAEGIKRLTSKKYADYEIEWLRMSTTVTTNALLEGRGEKFLLLCTKGFKDLSVIGNQQRPNIFDLSCSATNAQNVIQEACHVIEVDERVTVISDRRHLGDNEKVVRGSGGELLWVVKQLAREELQRIESQLKQSKHDGYESVGIVLMHAYTFAEHELLLLEICMRLQFKCVSVSHQCCPSVKYLNRFNSVSVDAYLTPHIQQYLDQFRQSLQQSIGDGSFPKTYFMQSDGLLSSVDNFRGFKSILSGPAGGLLACAMTHYSPEDKVPILTLDIGGTSTDVARYDGQLSMLYESVVNGVSMQVPQLDVRTVAAGGGSCLFYENGMLKVGPQSSGAQPGPTCYGNDGPLSITDVNLILGRIVPQYFPKLFGRNQDAGLDKEASLKKLGQLLDKVNADLEGKNKMSLEQLAMGFIEVANESVCRPIRELTLSRGYDASSHNLCVFGGAGSQFACEVASQLGIGKVLIHRYSSVLSALGLMLTSEVAEDSRSVTLKLSPNSISRIQIALDELTLKCQNQMQQAGYKSIKTECFLNLRYEGTDHAVMTLLTNYSEVVTQFNDQHRQNFGFLPENSQIIIDDIRVRSLGLATMKISSFTMSHSDQIIVNARNAESQEQVYFKSTGFLTTPVFMLGKLIPHSVVSGPALLLDDNTTILVAPGCVAYLSAEKDIVINVQLEKQRQLSANYCDPIQLSVFANKFMSIAEQMGRFLERTAVSTNIKERLDFSCALFSADGGLVANAPHIPVHLGSMQDCIRYQLAHYAKTDSGQLQEGDVLVTNHPAMGGTHLPDITVISPVFVDGKIVFVVASRAHHADIGGKTAGSMPFDSHCLAEEGAIIESLKIVRKGQFNVEAITKLLLEDPVSEKYGCSGTRNLKDNLADLKSQIAANVRGIQLLNEMIACYGLSVVQAYMIFIRNAAAEAVKSMLKTIAAIHGSTLTACDCMDDGSVIKLKIDISKEGVAVFDFDGTSLCSNNNINAPAAITKSALIYSLRCMLNSEVPLNEGILQNCVINIPDGSLLKPYDDSAVVAGNTLTSQRIVDVVLIAFKAASNSQGCMNNLLFGQDPHGETAGYGYYETIAGGTGAGRGWNGRSCHSHMTNTRITDPEIFERRYPVLLEEFSVRQHSGGNGQFRGGDGLIRRIKFLQDNMSFSILSERRVTQPQGLDGGHHGQRGLNTLFKHNGQKYNLGGKNSLRLQFGDAIEIRTPGGAGYGTK